MTARPGLVASLAVALGRTHDWFEVNSGWAPPDPETLRDWAAEHACRTPDDCWVELRGVCPHGLVSWQVILEDLEVLDGHGPAAAAVGAIRLDTGSDTDTNTGSGSGADVCGPHEKA